MNVPIYPEEAQPSPIQTASTHMVALKNEACKLEHNTNPDIDAIMVHYAHLTNAHLELTSDYTKGFRMFQQAFLARRRTRAKEYKNLRTKGNITAKDAENFSMIESDEEYAKEIDAECKYEEYRAFLRSIEKAIDFARSLQSYLQKQ